MAFEDTVSYTCLFLLCVLSGASSEAYSGILSVSKYLPVHSFTHSPPATYPFIRLLTRSVIQTASHLPPTCRSIRHPPLSSYHQPASATCPPSACSFIWPSSQKSRPSMSHLSIHSPVYPFIHLFISPLTHSFISSSLHPFVHLSVHLSLHLSAHLFIHPSIRQLATH